MAKVILNWVSDDASYALATVVETVNGIEFTCADGKIGLNADDQHEKGDHIEMPEGLKFSSIEYQYTNKETGEVRTGRRIHIA